MYGLDRKHLMLTDMEIYCKLITNLIRQFLCSQQYAVDYSFISLSLDQNVFYLAN